MSVELVKGERGLLAISLGAPQGSVHALPPDQCSVYGCRTALGVAESVGDPAGADRICVEGGVGT
jgi:hypothetical protein